MQQGPETSRSEASFAQRVADLGDRLGRVGLRKSAEAESERELAGRGMAYGMRMAAELVAAVIVGGLIGIGLDTWLGTRPWLFVLFFLLGFAAGVLNVVRAYGRIAKEIAATTRIGERVVDDD